MISFHCLIVIQQGQIQEFAKEWGRSLPFSLSSLPCSFPVSLPSPLEVWPIKPAI